MTSTRTWSVIKSRATNHAVVLEIHYSKAVFRQHRKFEDELRPRTGTGWRRADDGDAFLIGRLPKQTYSPTVRTKRDFVRRRTGRWKEVKKWEKFTSPELLRHPTNWCSCSSWSPPSPEGRLYHSVAVWSDCYCMRPPKAGLYNSVYSAAESIYLWALKFNARSGCFAGNCTGLGQWFRKAFIWPEQIAVKRRGGSGFPGTRIGPI